MQRDRKLSSDNELDLKYILTFTAAFVVISSIILVAAYALLTVTGILGQGQAAITGTPTPAPGSTTARPTYVVIGVPTNQPSPEPTLHATPSPSPSPTPVPSPYKVGVSINQVRAGSMEYNVTINMVPGYQPLDMSRVQLVIKDWETTYCNYNYDAMMYYLDGCWLNSNGDKRLDPTGETLTFAVNAYSLKIPLDRETRFILSLDGTEVLNLPLPSFQNYADTSGQSPDPGSGGIVQNPDNVVRWY
jgi:hypothetical protein